MDWINFLTTILMWWPWLSLWTDVWFLQFCIVYLTYLLIVSTNLYYILLYVFLQIIYFGIFLAIIQMEFFTGFLWVVEFTVVFISVLVLFYLNSTGITTKKRQINYLFYYFGFFLLVFFNYEFPSELENYLPIELNIFDLWDDYYEALYNTNMNDFMGLLLSYYYINSFEFLLIGFLLLIGSVGCVNLFKLNRTSKVAHYDVFFKIFNFFNDFVDYIFMRKQNLTKQNNSSASTRMFKKK